MKKLMQFSSALALALSSTFSLGAYAAVDPINLKTSFATLDDPDVSVAADGTMATFNESGIATFLRLTNDPHQPSPGDPVVVIPAPGRTLGFEYSFVEAAGGNDAFSAFLFDASLGIVGGLLDFFEVDATASGFNTFDLAPHVGKTLGLEFELAERDIVGGTLGSSATVANLVLTTVPLPGALWGLLGALGVVLGWQARGSEGKQMSRLRIG